MVVHEFAPEVKIACTLVEAVPMFWTCRPLVLLPNFSLYSGAATTVVAPPPLSRLYAVADWMPGLGAGSRYDSFTMPTMLPPVDSNFAEARQPSGMVAGLR